jgi:hypothetical protein
LFRALLWHLPGAWSGLGLLALGIFLLPVPFVGLLVIILGIVRIFIGGGKEENH